MHPGYRQTGSQRSPQCTPVMLGISSALDRIIYMLRSNEFKRVFKKIFRGASVEPSRAPTTHIGVTRLDATTSGIQNDPPSFLGVPVVSATSVEARRPRLDS